MPDVPLPSSSEFRVGVICALEIEGNAVHVLFDKVWQLKDICRPIDNDAYYKQPSNYNVGMIGHHHVVLVWLPNAGKPTAISEAAKLERYFENLKLLLVVGICGGSPLEGMHFGDAVISTGLIPYDAGKQEKDRFVPREPMRAPNPDLGGFLRRLSSNSSKRTLQNAAQAHLQSKPLNDEYKKTKPPTIQKDPQKPSVYFGNVASGDIVIKWEEFRKEIDKRGPSRPIAYEMEGAGVDDVFRGRVIVIKSVVDYANEEKTKEYQPYAALTAAAYMRAFLDEWKPPLKPTESSLGEAKRTAKRVVAKWVGATSHTKDGDSVKNVRRLHHRDRSMQAVTDRAPPINSALAEHTVPEPLRERVDSGLGELNSNVREPDSSSKRESHDAAPLREKENSREVDGKASESPAQEATAAAQRSCSEDTADPGKLSRMSTASTFVGSHRGEIEEVKPNTFSFDKFEKPVVVSITKVKSKSQETEDLFAACKQRSLEEVQRLLSTGEADPCALNPAGQTMLHVAIGTAKVDESISTMQKIAAVIDALCTNNADPNAKDKHGVAPIHRSVTTMNIEAAKQLLAHGADVNILDNRKRTALTYMALEGFPDKDFTRFLISEGGKPGSAALPKVKRNESSRWWEVRTMIEKVPRVT